MALADRNSIPSSKRDHIWSTSGIDPLIQSLEKRCKMLYSKEIILAKRNQADSRYRQHLICITQHLA